MPDAIIPQSDDYRRRKGLESDLADLIERVKRLEAARPPTASRRSAAHPGAGRQRAGPEATDVGHVEAPKEGTGIRENWPERLLSPKRSHGVARCPIRHSAIRGRQIERPPRGFWGTPKAAGRLVRIKQEDGSSRPTRRCEAAMRARTSMSPVTTPSTLDWREYWRAHGTSWRRLFELHAAIVNRLITVVFVMTACSICGDQPCRNPSFCRACRDTDRRKARGEPPRYIEPSRWHGPSDRIPGNWREMSIEALIAHFDRARRREGAPQPAVEALMYSLRERGTKALEEAAI